MLTAWIVALIVAVLAVPAMATAGTVGVSPSATSLAGDGGGTTTVTARAPVAGPGTIAQSLTQSFDPSRLALTGATGVIAPQGWTLSYSSDGSTFGAAPGSPAGWAAIRAVRATGSIASGGDAAGFQIATGSGSGTVPPSGAFNAGGSGDGWDVAFDATGHVFNTYHHDGAWWNGFSTPGMDCHTRTGGSCGPGWPFSLRIAAGTTGPGGIVGQPWYHTGDEAQEWVDTVNQRVWIPTTLANGVPAESGSGFVCVDVSDLATGPAWCGGNITNAFVKMIAPNGCAGRNCSPGIAFAAGRLFAWDAGSGKLMCLEPEGTHGAGYPGGPCAGQPFTIPGITSASSTASTLGTVQGLVFGSSGTTAMCFDPDALVSCPAWASSGGSLTATGRSVADVPQADGTAGSACFTGFNGGATNFMPVNCFPADGSSTTPDNVAAQAAGFRTYMAGVTVYAIGPKNPETAGTRLYWADGKWPGSGVIHCWDTSLASGAGATCPNFPVGRNAYTATVDTQNTNCIWTNTDSGQITTIDAVTGGSTCVTPPAAATFDAPVLLPRLACSGAGAVHEWRRFDLTGPAANTYTTARLTVLKATGQIVPGWNRVLIPAVSRSLDLTSLSVALSGQSPRFRVELAGKSTNDPIEGTLMAAGDAPQLCLPLQAKAACPSAPARVPGPMPTPTPAVITGTGEANDGSTTDTFGPGTGTVSFTAPADATCLGTISGTTTMAQGGAAVPSAHVRLLDPSGVEVDSADTDGTGAYFFTRLVAGAGYRVEFGPVTDASATPATDASVTTNRTIVAAGNTVVNGQYGLLRTNPLTGTGPNATPVVVTAQPHTAAGLADPTAFTPAATCVVDPADRVCKTSVTVPGEGTWTAGAGMAITFTPLSSFSGTATSVRYRVTETASGDTTWNTAVVSIDAPIPPVPVPPTTTPPAAEQSVPALPTTTPPVSTSTSTLRTVVVVPGAGRVTQQGRTTATASTPQVAACTAAPVQATGAGSVTVSCRLSPGTLALLRTRPVRVTLVTRFAGADGTVLTSTKVVVLARRRTHRVPVTG